MCCPSCAGGSRARCPLWTAATRSFSSTTARAIGRRRSSRAGSPTGGPSSSSQLSRNFGMEVAMSAGLDHARGEYVVLMHADLQDPPELIPEMLRARGRGRRRRLRAAHRARREPPQAHAGDRLLRADGAPGARSLPGPGGRLPADVAARGRRAARRCPSGAASCAGWSPGWASSRCRSSTAGPGAAAARGASYPALFRLAVEAFASFSDVPLALATYLGSSRRARQRARPAVVLVADARPAGEREPRACGSWSRCCSSAACS